MSEKIKPQLEQPGVRVFGVRRYPAYPRAEVGAGYPAAGRTEIGGAVLLMQAKDA